MINKLIWRSLALLLQEATETTEGESEQLRDNGVYYVLMQDGRLQMVRYRTAPLRSQSKAQRSNRFTEASKKAESQLAKSQLNQIQAHQAQFQSRPARIQQQPAKFNQQPTRSNNQFNQRSAQINQQSQPFHYVEIQKSHEIEVAQPVPDTAPTGFVANLQYRNVEPISAPIFAYNPAPLTRILKKWSVSIKTKCADFQIYLFYAYHTNKHWLFYTILFIYSLLHHSTVFI